MESTGVWERGTLDSDSLVSVRAAWNDEFDFSVICIAQLGTSVICSINNPSGLHPIQTLPIAW